MAAEPVKVEAEPADAVALGKLHLTVLDFHVTEVVVTHVDGHPGLVVTVKLGPCPAHVGPLGEPFSPPLVVFRYGMKLGQVESDQPHRALDCGRASELRHECRSGGTFGGNPAWFAVLFRRRCGGGPEPVTQTAGDDAAHPGRRVPSVERQHGLGCLAELSGP